MCMLLVGARYQYLTLTLPALSLLSIPIPLMTGNDPISPLFRQCISFMLFSAKVAWVRSFALR